MEEQKISVVIPCYNVEQTLKMTLDGVLEQDYSQEMEILVVDGGSNDRTPDIARKYEEHNENVMLVKEETNTYAEAINKGISLSSNPLLCVINPDCVPEQKNWLSRMVESLEPEEKIVGAQSVNVIPENLANSSSLFYRLIYGNRQPRKIEDVREIPFNFLPNGYVALKDVIEDVGMLDAETYSKAGEDYDISLRIQNKDYRSTIVSSVLLHYHSQGEEFGLKDYLAKQLQYSEAQGAIMRQYPFAKRYPIWNEFTKSGLYISTMVPVVNLLTVPLLFTYLYLFIWRSSDVLSGTEYLKAPLVKVLGDLYNIIGFYRGFLTSKQSATSHRFWK